MNINSISNYNFNFLGVLNRSTYESVLREYPKLLLSDKTKVYEDKYFPEFTDDYQDKCINNEALDEILAINTHINPDILVEHWDIDYDINENDFINLKQIKTKSKLRGYKFQDGTIVTSDGDKFKPIKYKKFQDALSVVPLDNNMYLKAYTQYDSDKGEPIRKFELFTEKQFKQYMHKPKKIKGKQIDFDTARTLLGY